MAEVREPVQCKPFPHFDFFLLHFWSPQFDYYMRMDSDSEFKKPIQFDIMVGTAFLCRVPIRAASHLTLLFFACREA